MLELLQSHLCKILARAWTAGKCNAQPSENRKDRCIKVSAGAQNAQSDALLKRLRAESTFVRFFLIILMQPVCLTRNRMTSHCVSSFTESTQFVTHSDSVRRQRNWRKKRSRQTFTHVTDSGANDGDGGVGEELAGAGIHRQIVREKGTGKVTALRPSAPPPPFFFPPPVGASGPCALKSPSRDTPRRPGWCMFRPASIWMDSKTTSSRYEGRVWAGK